MHKLLLLWGLCCCGTLLLAQSVPRFQMPLYFEDAVGNRDTIVVGYDETASYNQLNPQFGEQLLATPFDSIFEVRAAHAIDAPHALSKKIIAQYENSIGDTCFSSAGIEIFIQARHLPITIRYDTALVNSSVCHQNMILSPDWFIFLMQYWWDAREYYCMIHTNVIVDTFTHLGATNPGDFWLTRSFEVEGQGIKDIPGYFWLIPRVGVCQNMVATKAPTLASASIILAPNPVSSTLRVTWPEAFSGRLEVIGSAGMQVLLRQTVQQSKMTEVDVGQLPGGLYFLSAVAANGQRSVQSFVVMH